MHSGYTTFTLFALPDLAAALVDNTDKAREGIEQMSDERITALGDSDYTRLLVEKYSVAEPTVDFDGISAHSEERMVQVDASNPMYYVDPSKKHRATVVIYHLPFTGDQTAFKLRPQQFLLWTIDVWMDRNDICFEVVSSGNDPAVVNARKDEIIRLFKAQLGCAAQQVRAYNAGLAGEIERTIQARKQRAREQARFVSGLDVPVNEKQ